jgi:hydroxymethylbilane synthase
MSPTLFPIYLKLEGRLCVVIGGGQVAARKISALLDSGARVRVVAPEVCAEIRAALSRPGLEHVARGYQRGDLAGATLVFAATDSQAVNAAVSEDAAEQEVLVNVADDPARCSFIMPSRLDIGPVAIAICTQGASPALARHLRLRLEQALGPAHGQLAELLGRLRPEVLSALASPEARKQAWERVLEGSVLELLERGESEAAEAEARRLLGLQPAAHRRFAIGTRGSKLALAQAQLVADALGEDGVACRLQVIATTGDRQRGRLGAAGTGVFVREIEEALAAGRIDLAVHSLKDLPVQGRPGLVIAAIPERADPSDAFVTGARVGFAGLSPGARVATSSPRRAAQLRAHRSDLQYVPVRGNVDTRLRKLAQGDFDGLVVASAALARLGLMDRADERLPYEICLPAPGQGALAVQVREDDEAARALAAALDHLPDRQAVTAERSFLARLGAGCSVPAAALATVAEGSLVLQGLVAAPDGSRVIRGSTEGPATEAEVLGAALAERLLREGAQELLR